MQEKQKSEIPSTEDTPFRNQIFTSHAEQKFFSKYRSFFSIAEIEKSFLLQWVFGALLLTYFVTFFHYAQTGHTTVQAFVQNAYLCWPHWQSCGEYYFLSNLPYGHTQGILYTFLFFIMLLTVGSIWKKDWVLAHMLLSILFIWKFFVVFFYTGMGGGNFDYFDLIFSIVLLGLPHKLFFLKVCFALLYFLAATIKIHEGWILGTYFTQLKTGLPIFPDSLTPLFTNAVIFMQIIGTWFLLSSTKVWQRAAVFYFLTFHLYSGVIVFYRYMISTVPMLLILFGPRYTPTPVPLDKKSIAGWIFLLVLFCFQLMPLTIEGDQKMTLEGNQYGLYMFEANHQCVSQVDITDIHGSTTQLYRESFSARDRCDPYRSWFRINQICKRDPTIARVSWTFDHSNNDNPFYRIVDTDDACSLTYKPFTHNEWIKLPEENPEVIGHPVKNIYYYRP